MRCLFYAVNRYAKEKGYVSFRGTRLGKIKWWPHVLWFPPECANCDKPRSFVPFEDKVRWIFPFWFKGYVKEGDRPKEENK